MWKIIFLLFIVCQIQWWINGVIGYWRWCSRKMYYQWSTITKLQACITHNITIRMISSFFEQTCTPIDYTHSYTRKFQSWMDNNIHAMQSSLHVHQHSLLNTFTLNHSCPWRNMLPLSEGILAPAQNLSYITTPCFGIWCREPRSKPGRCISQTMTISKT